MVCVICNEKLRLFREAGENSQPPALNKKDRDALNKRFEKGRVHAPTEIQKLWENLKGQKGNRKIKQALCWAWVRNMGKWDSVMMAECTELMDGKKRALPGIGFR